MKYTHWNINELPWDQLDSAKVTPDLLKIIKAAALVEYNAYSYAEYLCKVFVDDQEFQNATEQWALEEIQHGKALGMWAQKIDPNWNMDAAMKKFRAGYKIEHFMGDVDASVRGSRAGELVARCMVEVGTSSYYSALGNACEEPVLKEICKKIAGDEFRHYKLFYDHLNRYLDSESLGKMGRLKVAISRISESEDDELAYAYFAANANDNEKYCRKLHSREYLSRAYSYYKKPEVDRAVSMIFKACGLKPRSVAYTMATKIVWWKFEAESRRMQRIAA